LVIHLGGQIIIGTGSRVDLEGITVGTNEAGFGTVTAKEKFIAGRAVGIDAYVDGFRHFGARLKISINRNTHATWYGNRGGIGKSVLGIRNEEKDTNKSGEC